MRTTAVSMSSRRGLRGYAALVIAPVTLLAMILLPAGGARASVTASPGRSTAPSQGSARPGQPARPAPAKRAGPAQHSPAGRAAAMPKDVRRVCAVPRRGRMACMALLRTNVKAHKGLLAPNTTPPGYGPPDLQSAYSLPSATAGSGETVAIVDAYDDPTAEADLGFYRAQYGLPPCTTANGCFAKVNQDGQASPLPPPAGSNGWDVEESLDIDMVSAICPNCHITLVEANGADGSDLAAAEDAAVALGAKYVSNSWGSDEFPSLDQQYDQYFDHPGVAITVAGGDSGYLDGDGSDSWPATNPDVTAVGGTTLTRDPGVPRGWDETVWGSSGGGEGTGSGCSSYQTKPAWQHDSGCPNRTTNDVSAVGNPATGVAMYDSYSQGGWLVVGGTSVATPIIASVYALAGPPAAGSYPASYPYAVPSALNDITSGANGTCTPPASDAPLCTAGPGYDGPTGLGTPDGVAAFSGGPHGDITGEVTAKATGSPVAGATVTTSQGYSATTNAQGDYDLSLPVGSYDLTAGAFGYKKQTRDGVQASQGQTTTASFALAALPTATLSGTVSDGSGHKWPLYAKITVAGSPLAPVYTDPYTGAYSVSLPQHATYQLQVTPVGLSGYTATNLSISIGTADKQKNIKPTVAGSCDAPGYTIISKVIETFDNVGTTAPAAGQ